MTGQDNTTAGGDPTEDEDDYFTQAERESLAYWRPIVAQRPPMTQEQIESVAALFRLIDANRTTE